MVPILGIVRKPRSGEAGFLDRTLARMAESASDSYTSDELGCAVAVASSNQSARTAHWNTDRTTGVWLSGELCPAVAAESLLRHYNDVGESCLEGLNGRFGGAIVDTAQGKFILFTDRFGLGRIYFYEDEEAFYFSSRVRSLLRVIPQARELDQRSLAEFCSCGCVLQNRTLFRGISILPPAACWTFSRDGDTSRGSYFDSSTWENQTPLSGADYDQALKSVFAEIMPPYLEGAVGMSLTGGLDGRMIMAWAKAPPGQLPCYTFGGSYRESNDVRVARRVAEVCHQPHTVIQVGSDFLSSFSELAEESIRLSDGTMDVAGAVEIYVNRKAREIAPIRLTGNYGSEILRGTIAFKPGVLNDELYVDEFLAAGRVATLTYEQEAKANRRSFIAFKQVPWHHFARLSLEESQLTVRTPFLDNALVALTFRTPAHAAISNEPSLRLIAAGNHALAAIPTDRGVSYSKTAANYFELLRVKAEYAFDYGMPQWLAATDRRLSRLHLERFFLGRHKFAHFRVWYRNQLADYVREILLDPRSLARPYLQRGAVAKIVEEHVSGRRNYTREIHQLLSLELLQRIFIDGGGEI